MGIRVGILGPLEVRDDSGQQLAVGGPRLRSLLIRLAISPGRSVPADSLAADLWAEDAAAASSNAVQALVSRLRNAIGRDVVEHGPTGYRLSVAPDDVDARAFEIAFAAGHDLLSGGDDAGAAARLRSALNMWRGPALADVADAPFAAPTITRLSELRLAALEDRIDADLALGRGAELVPELDELATAHPLRERIAGQLMRALYAAGRQADALGVFEEARLRLTSTLGVDPSPALAAIHLAVLRGELPGPVPPARAASTRAAPSAQPPSRVGNLPAQLTSFVGRDEELRRVTKLLGESRLITLTGPGGSGKTRLSIEVGARLADQVSDGVWFVPLAPVRDASDVPQAVLTAVDGRQTAWPVDAVEAARLAAMEPLDRLSEVLAARTAVIVLDNCEHVLDAVAALSGRLLADAPRMRILATSREPLGLTGETLCPVPSLPLPSPDADASEAAASAAVRLFVDRAAAVRPGFSLSPESAGPVVHICRALDGIPLAIELAAARVRALTPAQVADRLDDRFALLSVGARGVLPRHQTLRAIIDWSWDLLDDSERVVLRRLSVFSGGATPDSAERVCSLGGDSAVVVNVVASLVDKSLVVATGEHEVRYRLLETVRAYAADRLAESGESDYAAAAHAEYFLALAERAEPELRGPDQIAWLDRLTAEHDNCSAAIRYVVGTGDAARALRFVRSLAWFWVMRDYDTEAGEWAAEVLRLSGDTAPAGLAEAYAMCQLFVAIGRIAMSPPDNDHQLQQAIAGLQLPPDISDPLLVMVAPMLAVLSGDQERAARDLKAISQHPDPWVRGAGQALSGHLSIHDGDIERAAAELAAGYDMFLGLGDRFGRIACLTGLAEVAIARGRPQEAVRALEEVLGYSAEGLAGNLSKTMLVPLGRAKALAGDISGARGDLEESIRLAEKIGELDDVAMAYVELSEISRREGDLPRSRELLGRALEMVESNSQRPDMIGASAITFSRLGCVDEQTGDLAAAGQWQRRAIEVLSGSLLAILPINPMLATVVEGIAALIAARGEHVRAAELLGLAHALQGFCNAASLEVSRAKAAIGPALSKADAEAAYARGRRMGRDEALALTP
ncbi:MAG TPA: BTAD domain-containing putative transcriptional regulator [Streptosporangiaceae bacterium]|nr:BTAD domain-containing putative transcriptional regulator [Streptosporangiaceae bacterium]